MTVASPTNSVTYTGNGVTTVFDYDFLILEGTAQVTLTTIATGAESDPLNPALYTITGEDDENGGTITYPLSGSPLAATHKINIKRIVDIEQVLNLNNQSGYFPDLLESQLDRIVMMIGQQQEQINRAILIGTGATTDPEDLVQDLLTARDEAETAATNAAASQTAAAGSASAAATSAAAAAAALSAAGLPNPTTALRYLRRNAGNTAYEELTKAQVLADLSPITTRGDFIRGGVAGVSERVALGVLGTLLGSDGTDVAWLLNSSPVGQCRFAVSGGNVVLSPYNGNLIKIAGLMYAIPDAGVTLAPTGLTPSTNYYIYAYMSGSTMTLEASATGHAVSTTAGNKGTEIKSGDNTRTLVGFARIVAGPAWSTQTGHCLSWFNRRSLTYTATLGNLNTASSAIVALGAVQSALSWADAEVRVLLYGQTVNGGSYNQVSIGIDGTTLFGTSQAFGYSTTSADNYCIEGEALVSDGYHTFGLLGAQNGGGTANFLNSQIKMTVQG